MKNAKVLGLLAACTLACTACGSANGGSATNGGTPAAEETTGASETVETKNEDSSTVEGGSSSEVAPAEDFNCVELEDGTFAIKSYKGNASVVVVPEEIEGKKVTSVDGINNKDSITKIVLPNTITVIEDDAFSDNMYLEEIVLGNNIVSIGKRAFGLDTKLSSITLPDTVTEIGPKAFYVCGIEEIKIPAGVTVIKDSTFAGSIMTHITIPGSVKTIGTSAFTESEIEEVVIEEGVETIEDSAFSGCKNLTRIEIPASVTSIATDFEKNCTIVAPTGSYAEKFASENGYNFEAK